jgi:MFS transporter, PPP family, 3-phenylpropionic acid transporter
LHALPLEKNCVIINPKKCEAIHLTAGTLPITLPSTQKRGIRTVKTLYFLIFAAIGAFFPFLNIYYYSIGLSGTQIGLINTLAPLVGAFSAVIWGMVNDRYGRIRLLLTFITMGVIGMVLLLSRAGIFWLILPTAGLLSLFGSPMNSLLDSTTLRLLGDRKEDYGRCRIWGAYGFILTSSLTGFLLARAGMVWIFYFYAGSMALFLLAVQWLPTQPPAKYGLSILKGVNVLVRNPSWLIFAASVFLTWMAVMGGFIFVGVTMKQMGAGTQLIGLASTAAAVAEIPVMYRSSSLLKRFGATRLVSFGILMYGVREGMYAIMQAPIWVPFINLLQAVTYVPFWIGSVAYASELAPDELKSTSQGLLFMVMNLSNVLGALVSGWLFDHIGPRGLYTFLMGLCLTSFALFTFGRFSMERKMERVAK